MHMPTMHTCANSLFPTAHAHRVQSMRANFLSSNSRAQTIENTSLAVFWSRLNPSFDLDEESLPGTGLHISSDMRPGRVYMGPEGPNTMGGPFYSHFVIYM